MCELWWTNLTTCDVSASPEAVICQIHAKEMMCLLGDRPESRIRCGGQGRWLKIKMMFLTGGGLRTHMSRSREV